jgi:hypothetical protein
LGIKAWEGDLGTVVVICPVTCREISTGIETEAEVLKGLPRIQSAVRCPECGEQHFWTCDDAMIVQERAKSPVRDTGV